MLTIWDQKDKQILGPCQRTEKAVEHKGDSDTNSRWRTWNCLKGLEIRERIQTIQTIQTKGLLKSARILRMLELFYCNGDILEGTFIVVTAVKK